MSKKPVKVSTLLTRAAKHLEENGWVQGFFWKYRNGRRLDLIRDGEYRPFEEQVKVAREKACPACLRGALYLADVEVDPSDSATREHRHSQAMRYVEQITPVYPVEWNDAKDTTKEEVVQTLKEAAKAARKDGK